MVAAIATAALLACAAAAPAAQAVTWNLPAQTLSTPSTGANFARVAVGPDGATTVVWRRSNGSNFIVQVATRAAGASSFGAPEDLSAAGQDAYWPAVAVGPDGATTVVWSLNEEIIQARTRPAGSSTFGTTQDLSAGGLFANFTAVATGANGDSAMVWGRSNGLNDIAQGTIRPAGESSFVTPAQDLSATGESVSPPQVAVGPDGTTTVVWGRSNGTDQIIQSATRAAGSSSFGTPQDLSATGQSADNPRLAVGPDGTTTVVWRRSNGTNNIIQVATRAAGSSSFGTPQDLSAAGQNANTSGVAVGPDGATTVVWRRSNGTNNIIQVATRAAGSSSFGTPQDLSATGQNADNAQVAVGPDGATTVVWERSNGSNTIIQVVTRAAGSSSFGTPQDLSATGQNAGSPQVAVGPDGVATVAWRYGVNPNQVIQATSSYPTTYTLTVSRDGSGQGTVTSSPAGIDCGANCQALFNLSTQVTLTATPASGSTFSGWSGGGCSGTATCVVTMDQAKSVNANFVASTYELSVNKSVADTGTGVVTSAPSGINCGTTCQKTYDPGTQVTLTATADLGSRFTGWTGACTNQQGPCTLTMSDNRVVTARFQAVDTYSLTVAKQGNGQGIVISSPAGIDCGSSCESQFNDGEEVTLTASAAQGSTFGGWSGACTGTAPCQVTMDQARQVTATFGQAIPSYALSVTKQGQGQGTVTSNPSGINCGTACQASFEGGTEVTLTASAAGDSTFTGWSGACSGTGPCQVTMDQARQVTATFTALSPPRLSVTKYRPGPRRLNSSKIIRLAWVECKSGTCQIDDAEVSFKARGKAFPGTATYSNEPFGAGERRLISTKVPNAVNERLTSRKSGVAILNVKASARNGQLEEDVSRTVKQGLVRCPDSKCG